MSPSRGTPSPKPATTSTAAAAAGALPPIPRATAGGVNPLIAVGIGPEARRPAHDTLSARAHPDTRRNLAVAPPPGPRGGSAAFPAQPAGTPAPVISAHRRTGSEDSLGGGDGAESTELVRAASPQHAAATFTGVCGCCRDLLHQVYAHCFDASADPVLLPSPHAVNTAKDAIAGSPVPTALATLRAPSPGRLLMTPGTEAVVYADPVVAVHADAAAARARRRDALLRRFGVALKDKEIHALRANLAGEQAKAQRVAAQVGALQHALKRTLGYATTAEEWQKREAGRLVRDVEDLKEQVAALMVMYIHAEEEKAKMSQNLESARTEIAARDATIAARDASLREQQDQLHDAYREYLEMNTTIERLEREAVEGSGAARSRAEVLGQHLDRMSRDFDTTSRSLIAAQERSRQLEFELAAVIAQFNETGDARHVLQRNYDEINERFAELDAKHLQLTASHEEALASLKSVQDALTDEKRSHAETRAARLVEVHMLTKKLEEMTGAKAQVEGIVARLKAESEKLRGNVIELRSAKSDLEGNLAKVQHAYDTDTVALRSQIETATQGSASMTADLAKVTDHRERLQVQVNDLRSALERERTRANALDTEVKTLRVATTTARDEYENQITALAAAKTNLTSDKKELMETLSKARRDLIEKKVAYEDLEVKMEEWANAKAEEINNLNANIQSLQDALAKLTSQYTTLAGNHRTLKATHEELDRGHATARATIAAREADLAAARERIAELEVTRDQLEADVAAERATAAEQRDAIEVLEQRIESLETQLATAMGDWARQNAQHDDARRHLEASLANLRDQYRGLTLTHEQALAAHAKSKRDLARTRDALLEESAARSLLEMAVDDLRARYDGERRSRADYERLGMRLEKQSNAWVGDKVDAWAGRERAWAELDEWMSMQTARLDDMVTILGLEEPDAVAGADAKGRGRSASAAPRGMHSRAGSAMRLSRSTTPTNGRNVSATRSSAGRGGNKGWQHHGHGGGAAAAAFGAGLGGPPPARGHHAIRGIAE
ncbi:hypothetical protein H9P43_003599 [Blastocladiella emersonii ATCC 22665]|nr:hypothetical protein H9P43_003599 [Blastocladiella emersonii ATCC 22665]